MRVPILTANWKMHKVADEALRFVDDFLPRVAAARDVEIVLAVPFTLLDRVGRRLGESGVKLAAQNVHPEPKGAFTTPSSIMLSPRTLSAKFSPPRSRLGGISIGSGCSNGSNGRPAATSPNRGTSTPPGTIEFSPRVAWCAARPRALPSASSRASVLAACTCSCGGGSTSVRARLRPFQGERSAPRSAKARRCFCTAL